MKTVNKLSLEDVFGEVLDDKRSSLAFGFNALINFDKGNPHFLHLTTGHFLLTTAFFPSQETPESKIHSHN